MSLRILMCAPEHYDVVYEINPWMKKEEGVAQSLAVQQWQALKQTIEQCGAQVELIAPAPGWPDMVFTANAALLYGKKAFLANFLYPERQGEREFFKRWFEQQGFEIVNPEVTFDFEGAGDALFAGDTLFCGYGFRSEKNVYTDVAKMGAMQQVMCELVDPYFYHIDTCFCPLNESHAIWWPGAFSIESQTRMVNSGVTLHAVPESEAKHFACNAVVLDNKVIIPSRCPQTRSILEGLGFEVFDVPMSEFLKSGGACKCLTLKL